MYPPVQPYVSGFLRVSEVHELYYEVCGNPHAKHTAVFLHGGPGGTLSDTYRQFFDPHLYRVVLFNQRGAGKSKPSGCLQENTIWHLVEDIERLRNYINHTQELQIQKWIVLGGSWGSALALAYSEKYPERVKALIVCCVFTASRKEMDWTYKAGASFLWPEAWEKFLQPIPEAERPELLSAYHRRLTGADEQERQKCAKAWTLWELSTSSFFPDEEAIARASDETYSSVFSSFESEYFVHGGYLKYDGQLIQEAEKMKDVPGFIIHGRYDMVCPVSTAWELKKHWPRAELVIVPDAGHAPRDGIVREIIKATNTLASTLQ
uniref:Proline iminopeptidase n=1 Tax=Arcella intermedia TaxID=1963864 RepID=A0A6B2LA40_9EUKA